MRIEEIFPIVCDAVTTMVMALVVSVLCGMVAQEMAIAISGGDIVESSQVNPWEEMK